MSALAGAQDAAASDELYVPFHPIINRLTSILSALVLTTSFILSWTARSSPNSRPRRWLWVILPVPLIVGYAPFHSSWIESFTLASATSNESYAPGYDIPSSLRILFPGLDEKDTDDYLAAYPSSDFDSEEQRLAAAAGDSLNGCCVSTYGCLFFGSVTILRKATNTGKWVF